ncbi:hypothetical protein EST38_g9701 [Candolleomyces aberdarensis]|uniref:Uncharacterized protein n=1 Tax=Candolleomyces aberdarensis TaxID=2316362 RepID=A0A4Q2DAZ4_9AGAR|nr:hypothetical protein EST38_g9701 [Candolleomyces aberdarensis]
MSPTSNLLSISKLYKLKEDGSNRAIYQDRTTDYLKGKGLRCHLNGCVKIPIKVVEHFNKSTNVTKFFNPTDTAFATPLSDKAIEKLKDTAFNYNKNKCIGSDAMFKHHRNIVQIDILTKFQSADYTSGSMRAFLSQLTEWQNNLLNNNYTLSDSQFVTYITTSLSTTSDYHMFISAIEGTAKVTSTMLTSEVLKKWLKAEHKARNRTNSNDTTSRLATTALAASCSKDTKGRKKKKSEYFCTICNVNGHSKKRCFAEGGGRHNQAPEWYKKKQVEQLTNVNTTLTSTTLKATNVSTVAKNHSCAVECLPSNTDEISAAKLETQHTKPTHST